MTDLRKVRVLVSERIDDLLDEQVNILEKIKEESKRHPLGLGPLEGQGRQILDLLRQMEGDLDNVQIHRTKLPKWDEAPSRRKAELEMKYGRKGVTARKGKEGKEKNGENEKSKDGKSKDEKGKKDKHKGKNKREKSKKKRNRSSSSSDSSAKTGRTMIRSKKPEKNQKKQNESLLPFLDSNYKSRSLEAGSGPRNNPTQVPPQYYPIMYPMPYPLQYPFPKPPSPSPPSQQKFFTVKLRDGMTVVMDQDEYMAYNLGINTCEPADGGEQRKRLGRVIMMNTENQTSGFGEPVRKSDKQIQLSRRSSAMNEVPSNDGAVYYNRIRPPNKHDPLPRIEKYQLRPGHRQPYRIDSSTQKDDAKDLNTSAMASGLKEPNNTLDSNVLKQDFTLDFTGDKLNDGTQFENRKKPTVINYVTDVREVTEANDSYHPIVKDVKPPAKTVSAVVKPKHSANKSYSMVDNHNESDPLEKMRKRIIRGKTEPEDSEIIRIAHNDRMDSFRIDKKPDKLRPDSTRILDKEPSFQSQIDPKNYLSERQISPKDAKKPNANNSLNNGNSTRKNPYLDTPLQKKVTVANRRSIRISFIRMIH